MTEKHHTPDPVTVKTGEAAQMLGISYSTLRRLIRNGDIKTITPPGMRISLIEVSELHRFVARSKRSKK